MIRLQDVTFAYGAGPPVLEGVDLTVAPGEMVALVGPNGSGKSTLARLLNGLLLPARGRVLVGGLDTRKAADRREIRRRVGLVFQDPDSQLVASTVAEEVAFGPQNLGWPVAEIRRRVEEALVAVGLAGLEEREVHTLSGGQKQLLAVAGVLAMRPAVLVLDEPASMLDPAARGRLWEAVGRLHREAGLTVVLITHQAEEAARAGRVVVLREGRVVQEGTPQEVFAGPAGWAEDLDLPPLAELARLLREAGLQSVPPFPQDVEEMVKGLCTCNWTR